MWHVSALPSFSSLNNIPWYEYITFCVSIHHLMGHLGCFHFWATVNYAALNIHTRDFVGTPFHLPWVDDWQWNAAWSGDSMISILRTRPTVFQSTFTMSYSRQQHTGSSFLPALVSICVAQGVLIQMACLSQLALHCSFGDSRTRLSISLMASLRGRPKCLFCMPGQSTLVRAPQTYLEKRFSTIFAWCQDST